jgi:small subunit ribosomal protein S1
MVIESDADNRNIRLGVKQLSEDPWTSFATAFRVGSIVDGTVSSITDFGVFVKVQGEIEGLVNKSNLSQDREVTFEEAVKKLEVGLAIKAVITELSPDRQKLSLSVRDLVRKQQREELSRFMHDEGEGGEGFTLGDLLKQKGDKN